METKSITKKYIFWTVAMICCSLGFLSCKKDDAKLRVTENYDFAVKASVANHLEITAGELAKTKTTSDPVKQFSEQMVNNHQSLDAELRAIALKKEWTLSVALEEKDQQKIDHLSTLSGADFDREYIQLIIESHEETIALFEQAISDNGLRDAELRQWAKLKLPELRTHLQEALTLKQTSGQ